MLAGQSIKVKDVFIKCARLLNISEIYDNDDIINIGETIDNKVIFNDHLIKEMKSVGKMLEFLNLCLCEIAHDHYLFIDTYTTSTSQGTVIFVNQMLPIIKILKVSCKCGDQKFTFHIDKIKVDHSDVYTITYAYLPYYFSLVHEVKVRHQCGLDTLIFGICAYYCLSEGMYDEYQIYYKKYKERMEAIPKGIINTPMRKWL